MLVYEASKEAVRELGVDLDVGLSSTQAELHRQRYGENRYPEPKTRSWMSMIVEALKDKTLIILMGAAVIALGVEAAQVTLVEGHTANFTDGLAIFVAVFIATAVTVFNEARAAKAFLSLRRERSDVAIKVKRDGRPQTISVHELVAGDIVLFDAGDRIPADGVLLSGVDVRVDRSMLTGESAEVKRGEDAVELQAGSIVQSGSGTFLATAVGLRTEMGKLHGLLTADDSEVTPLQERLAGLADKIGVGGFVAAVFTFSALVLSAYSRAEIGLDLASGSLLLEYAIVAVTIIVVAVPEGLPVAVTISLAYSVRQMAKGKTLVRKLASCETMGAATVVCSDKTGTLTENRMSLASVWMPHDEVLSREDRERLAFSIAVNSTAHLETDDDGLTRYMGSPTECALLAAARDWGFSYSELRTGAEVRHQVGFDSSRKRMSTLCRTDDGYRWLVKGAPEVIISRCDRVHGQDGRVTPITGADRTRTIQHVERISGSGQRTLAFAYKDVADPDSDASEEGLVFFAVVGIRDPIRPEVHRAIQQAKEAGVNIVVVTGDNRGIGEAIGRELELVQPGDLIMEGADFRSKSDEDVTALLPRLRVLARSVPSDKHRLVRLFQALGEVVAVTGDGTNDAPALKTADVGFSMGRSGTEVAKEASDIVLVDDNFQSIVQAIAWGRSIFDNIRKFLQFQLTVNIVALTTAFSAAVFGFGIPLNTVQLLWVNLIMDALAALALAVEPPDPKVLETEPHGRSAPLITRSMWANILTMSAMMLVILLGIMRGHWFLPEGLPHAVQLTFVFNVFVWMQLFNEVNARSTRVDRSAWRGLFRSPLFIGVMVATALLQVAIVEHGGSFFRTVPLSGALWFRSIALGASILVLGALFRAAGRVLSTRLSPRFG